MTWSLVQVVVKDGEVMPGWTDEDVPSVSPGAPGHHALSLWLLDVAAGEHASVRFLCAYAAFFIGRRHAAFVS
jgi:hypothetical protein